MGKALRTAGLFWASNDYYGRALQRSEAKANLSSREAIMAAMGLNSLEVNGKQVAEASEKCLKEFPSSPHKPERVLNLGRAYAIAEKKDKAKKVFDRFSRQHPGSTESDKVKALLDSLS